MQTEQSAYVTLAEARTLIDDAISEAAKRGETTAVTIVDAGGWRLAEVRDDDAPLAALDEARADAEALATGEESESAFELSKSRPLRKGGRIVAGLGIAVRKLDGPADGPPPLSLADARRYVHGALAEATRLGSAVGIAVVDELGRVIQVLRMDGSAIGSSEMAEAKAMTALKFRRPTATLTEEFLDHSARLEAIEKLLDITFLAMAGGSPIFKLVQLVGALGVSGSGSQTAQIDGRRVTDADIVAAVLSDDGH